MIKKGVKAQGLPMNFIILAVLGLLVLIVLSIMFTGKTKIFSKGLQDCRTRQGECTVLPKVKCDPGKAEIFNAYCPDKKQKCCISVLDT